MIRYFVFDVDDVFVDMDRLAARAVESVGAPLIDALGETRGRTVQARFGAHYDILRTQLRSAPNERTPAFERLRDRIEHWQRGVLEQGHELKIWSRETMLATALEFEDVPVDGALVERVVEVYWSTLREHSRVFDDAARIVTRLRERGDHFHLATNSDGNLVFDGDTFTYDPEHARRTKWARLRVLESIGITADAVTIGDPIGKPHEGFFKTALDAFAERVSGIDRAQTIAVGDSYQDDIEPLLVVGVPKGFWILRRRGLRGTYEGDPRVERVTSLDEVLP